VPCGRPRRRPGRASMVTVAALGGAWGRLVAAAVLAPAAARDSGRFAAVLLGVPVVLAALPVG
jgi:hypothetical protein